MNCFHCCSKQKCCFCSGDNDNDLHNEGTEDIMEAIPTLRYALSNPHLEKRKSITEGSKENMDGLMDMALAQKRVTIFVPISRNIEFVRYMDYLNASTVIHPFSTFRLIWDSFIMLILIFTCFEIPFTLCFNIETSDIHSSYGQFILMIDIILCIDVLFNLRTAFYHKFDELRLVSNPYKIAIAYLKRWFFIDFITSFPIEFLFPPRVELGGAPAILRAFRIVRMIRLFKLVRFFRMLKLANTFLREAMGPKSSVIIRLLRLVAFMILAAHFAACLWFYVGMIHYDTDEDIDSWLQVQNVDISNKWDAYLVSMYWSIVTLFTTGYGDIIPVNKDEQCVAATVVLLGTCFFAYLIGAVGSLVAEGDRVRSIRESKLEEAQAFCANKHLPPKLSRAIITHIQYFWKRNFVYDEYEILQCLPFGIQYDILKYYGNKIFASFAPFHGIPATTKGFLALKLKQFSCNKGFTVYKNSDPAKEFYIQRTGQSCLIINENQSIDLNRGDIFGHIGFVKGYRFGTLFCKTWSEFYSLSMRDLEDILIMEHPQKWQKMMKDIKKCMKLYKTHETTKKKKKARKKSKHVQKLSIDLNQMKKKKRNSKFLSMLLHEDSVTRNNKILLEHRYTQRAQMEQEMDQLTECHIKFNDEDKNKNCKDGYIGGNKIASFISSSDSSDSCSSNASDSNSILHITSDDAYDAYDDDDYAASGLSGRPNIIYTKRKQNNNKVRKKRKVNKTTTTIIASSLKQSFHASKGRKVEELKMKAKKKEESSSSLSAALKVQVPKRVASTSDAYADTDAVAITYYKNKNNKEEEKAQNKSNTNHNNDNKKDDIHSEHFVD